MDFINDSLWILNIIGANPKRFTNTKVYVAFLMLNTLHPCYFELLFNRNQKESFEAFADVIAVLQTVLKLVIVVINKDKYVELLNMLDSFWALDAFVEVDKAKMGLKKFFLKYWKLSCLVFVSLYVWIPLFMSDRTLPLRSYFFSIDVYKSPFFEIVYVSQAICGYIGVIIMVGFDTLFVTLVFYVLDQINLIKQAFKHLRIEYNKITRFGELKDIINHHCRILKFIQKLNECYSLFFIIEFLTSIFCICGSLLILSTNGSTNIGISIKNNLYLLVFMGQIYFFCACGTYIIEETKSVADAAFTTKWCIKDQTKLRKDLILVILRSQRPAKLYGGGLFVLNFECFATIIKTGMSFYTLVRTVYTKYGDGI